MNDKPKILWLADKPGWAYDQIFQHQSRALPAYEHEVFYMVRGEIEWVDWVSLGQMLDKVDIIVSMHLMYFVQIKDLAAEKLVAMLTGPRAWE